MSVTGSPTLRDMRHALRQLACFVVLEASACAFAFALLAGMAVTAVVPLPIARYDALLLYAIALSGVFWALRLETGRELVAIAGFHVAGLAFEMAKVRMGSWEYPQDAVMKAGGVPLYAGFMYAAVGSYIARAWRLFDLRLTRYRPVATAVVAVLIYVNFLTHHVLWDIRAVLAVGLLAATWGTWVHFSVDGVRHRMPLTLGFALIGLFLWVAENIATLAQGYRYPNQHHGWDLVHVGKFGSWALLVVVSFVLVAAWKTSHLREESLRRVPATAAGATR